ncbi:DUF3107 domain-containing protein [Cellulomonas sp. PhB143]|uniref:DUF3107 domain-containing protein n=1 Tax=Cellulomonas sp. PhB143 TaxID=2485186 RepID=UPI000F467FB5|nr:DUF3107 domain-containing protein [Cellulomonas sp. PhB143]ROS76856.1 uncharacterized protein DUF3107 [Cellulomonas sp. PhB143]
MEVTIGVQNLGREIVVETDESADAVTKAVEKALKDGTVLQLTDIKGRRVVVPTTALGYVEIGAELQRRVGFGSV